MTPDEAETQLRLRRLLDALGALPRALFDIGMEHRMEPVAGSVAETEIHALPEFDAPRTALTSPGPLLTAAGDGVASLERLLTEPIHTIAPWGVARTVLELSARSAWLLAPEINVRERIRRSLNERLIDLREFANLADTVFLSKDSAQAVTETLRRGGRERQIKETARALGFPITKRDRMEWIGDATPSATRLCMITFDAVVEWRLLSAAEHGRRWALFELSYRTSEEHSDHGMTALEQSMTVEQLLWLVRNAFQWFSRAMWNYLYLNGWNLRAAIEVFDDFASKAYLVDAHRFWQDERTRNGTAGLADLRTRRLRFTNTAD